MKKIFTPTLIGFLAITLLFAACGSANQDPKKVLMSFFESIAKKDFDGAAKYATQGSKSTIDMIKKGMEMAEKMKDSLRNEDPMKDFKDVVYGDTKVKGDSAFITVTTKNEKQPPAEFVLIKEDGKWKVDFSMATLMKMGEKAGHSEDAPTFDSKTVKPEDIEKSMKMADSMLKNMDPKQIEEMQKSLEQLKNK